MLAYPHQVHPIFMSGESARENNTHNRQSVFNSLGQFAGPPNLEKELCYLVVPLFFPISNRQWVKQHVCREIYLHWLHWEIPEFPKLLGLVKSFNIYMSAPFWLHLFPLYKPLSIHSPDFPPNQSEHGFHYLLITFTSFACLLLTYNVIIGRLGE